MSSRTEGTGFTHNVDGECSTCWLLRDVSTQEELSEGHGNYEKSQRPRNMKKDTPDADEDHIII